MRRVYLDLPAPPTEPALMRKLVRILKGMSLALPTYIMAARHRTPGLDAHRRIVALALRLLLRLRSPLRLSWRLYLLLYPMDSTRYFEFDFALRVLAGGVPGRYLDVSSPRLLPVLLMLQQSGLQAELINPDASDLKLTEDLVKAARLGIRCDLRACTVETAPFQPESFDVITSISVIEHIVDDREALRSIWRLLKPGGRLVLTMPCAAQAAAQYSNVNHYGLVRPDESGACFVEYLYDEVMLRERIFSVTGEPAQMTIFGEKTPGFLMRHLLRRERDYDYPYWREPLTMGQEFRPYRDLASLPGEGVVGLVFQKA